MSQENNRWEIFEDSYKLWYFRYVEADGTVICQSVSYNDKPACNAGIDVLESAIRATVDATGTYSLLPRVELDLDGNPV